MYAQMQLPPFSLVPFSSETDTWLMHHSITQTKVKFEINYILANCYFLFCFLIGLHHSCLAAFHNWALQSALEPWFNLGLCKGVGSTQSWVAPALSPKFHRFCPISLGRCNSPISPEQAVFYRPWSQWISTCNQGILMSQRQQNGTSYWLLSDCKNIAPTINGNVWNKLII